MKTNRTNLVLTGRPQNPLRLISESRESLVLAHPPAVDATLILEIQTIGDFDPADFDPSDFDTT